MKTKTKKLDFSKLTKRDLKRMANRGELSGLELGLYTIWAYWEHDQGRREFFPNELYEWLLAKLPYAQQAEAGIWKDLYLVIDRTILESENQYLKALNQLHRMSYLGYSYFTWLNTTAIEAIGDNLSQAQEEILSLMTIQFKGYLDGAAESKHRESHEIKDEDEVELTANIRDIMADERDESNVQIKRFLSFRSVMTDLAVLLGVSLTEDIDSAYQELEAHADVYNSFVLRPDSGFFYEATDRDTRLPPINLNMLKPDRRWEKSYTERFEPFVGEDWRALAREGVSILGEASS